MSRFAKLFAANAIAAAGLCSAAIALSSTAAANPAVPPGVPGVPGLDMIQQFATNPASMGAVLQTAATALNGASTMVGAPAPATLPISPIEGAPGTAPATPAMPYAPAMPAMPYAPATPAGPVAAPTAVGSTLVPLLNQFGIPASLVNLAPTDLPFPLGLGNQSVTSPAAPVTAPLLPAALAPAAPAAAAAPAASAGLNPLPLLVGLP